MTAGFSRPIVQELCCALPSLHVQTTQTETKAPDANGGFLYDDEFKGPSEPGAITLDSVAGFAPVIGQTRPPEKTYTFAPHPAYEEYLRMEKVLARGQDIGKLIRIYDTLGSDVLPSHLSVAGWAAAEAAVMGTNLPTGQRQSLLDGAAKSWGQSLVNQVDINQRYPSIRKPGQPLRIGLDIAVLPLLEGIVKGNVTRERSVQSLEAVLQIANLNRQQLDAAKQEGDLMALQDHSGFSYELICLLSVNRLLSSSKFAIPSSIRGGSGHYLQEQTHDVLSLHQNWGVIRNAVPIEIKGRPSGHDRSRYKALLIRGYTYLRYGNLTADETLDAVTNAYWTPGGENDVAAETLTQQVTSMIKEYSLGEKIDIRSRKSVTDFRDSSRVLKQFPGLQPGLGHLMNLQVSLA